MQAEKTAQGRKSGAARILRPVDGGYVFSGCQPADAEDPAANPADCSGGRSGFHQRRERRGKRSGGADDSSALDEAATGIRKSELRRTAGRTSGVRAVWLRTRSVYRSGAGEAGKIRIGKQGNDFPQRDRGNAAASASKAAARAAG